MNCLGSGQAALEPGGRNMSQYSGTRAGFDAQLSLLYRAAFG
jgi:hypothetical protein